MDSDQHLKLHISIQKGLSTPTLRKCINCCYPAKFHCPFCLPSFFKPTKYSRARIHMDYHLKRAIYFGEYTIHRCRLDCRNRSHFHCLYCTATLMRKRDFNNHLPGCYQAQKSRAQELSQSPAEASIASYDRKSSDDEEDDDDDVTIITDSDNQGGSSSQQVTPIIECRTLKRKGSTKSSKFHQTVQANIEKPQDCDEYYFLNLVKIFKRLNPQKKAEVRMKIERVLFEAEFE